MGTQNSICLLLLLFLGATLADINMQENLDQTATQVNFRFRGRDCEFECDASRNQVVNKVEEFKDSCCEACHHLVRPCLDHFHLKTLFYNIPSGGGDL